PLDQLVGYVRGSLEAAPHARVERHLADCRPCANEIGDLVRLSGRKRSWFRPVPAGAMAAAAALFLVVWINRPPSPDPAATREQPLAGIAAPVPLSPSGKAATPVVFSWAAEGGVLYRVVLFDSLGSALFDGAAPTRALSLPDSIRLVPGALYLWKVEAEVAPDRWVSSDLVRFRPAGAASP
ncbi:MAG: zf-HC2 domain-containing protein, partial [Gemmatimonadales bacterium]